LPFSPPVSPRRLKSPRKTHAIPTRLIAAAIARQPVDLQASLGSFTGSGQDYIDAFFVPGIQRAGGLQAARKLAGTK
jgi:hypothetical protein